MSTTQADAGLSALVRSNPVTRRLAAIGTSEYAKGIAIVLFSAWLARTFWIDSFATASSTDATSWATVVRQLQEGHNPYVTTTFLNWGPFWLIMLFALSHIASAVGISFLLALRLLLISVESVLIVVVYDRLVKLTGDPVRARRVVLFGISLNPIAILMVCQHCNFDVIVALVMFWSALEAAAYARRRDATTLLTSAFSIGLGALVKTVPLALGPLLGFGLRGASGRARFLVASLVFGPLALALAVLYVLAPSATLHHVLLYRSTSDVYGITGVLSLVGLHGPADVWARVTPLLIVGWLVVGTRWLSRRPLDAAGTLLLVGLVMLAIPTFGPGYGTQYIYWWLPFLVATYPLFDRKWRQLLCALYAIAVVTYLFEYAVEPTYGGFLERSFISSPSLVRLGVTLQSPGWETAMRIPLFIASAIVLWQGVRRVRARATGTPATG